MAVVGAIVGLAMGGADSSVLGFFAGILIGWQGVRIAQLRHRIEQAEALARGASASAAATVLARNAEARAAAEANAGVARDGAEAAGRTPPVGAPVAPGPASAPSVADAADDGLAAAAASAMAAHVPPAPSIAAPAASQPAPPPVTAAAPNPAASASTASAAQAAAATRAQQPTAPRAPAAPPAPIAPPPPSGFERGIESIKRWFFTGNVPVKLGMLVLFFGIAAALKYAVDQGWLSAPIEFRLAGIAAAALGGLVWGWRNRSTRPAFGLSLQGGAIGVLLLTTFAAYRMYGVLPAGAAFALVLLLVAGAAALAVLQDAVALAVLGFVGGYLAPVLISTGSGNHVALFTYYAILNAAVFAIAWVRPWRALNLIGFAFTFGIGLAWGAEYYRPELFATVEPFVVLFFLFYVAIAVLYALRGNRGGRGDAVVDGTLVFGTPLLAFPLQAAMLVDDRHALAWSALGVALLYAGLAWWLRRRRDARLLGHSFAALALGFATLAVPLALSARWTCATWALEGVAVAWLGLRQHRQLPQFAGWALQGLAALAYISAFADIGIDADLGELPILNGHALSVLLMAGAALLLSRLYERANGHRALVWGGFLIGMGWWGVAGLREILQHFESDDLSLRFVWFLAITALLSGAMRVLLRWPRFGWNILAVAALGLPFACLSQVDAGSALQVPASLPWLAWFGALLFGLWSLRTPEQRGISFAHVAVLATAALLYGMGLYDVASQQPDLGDAWLYLACIAPLALLLLATWRLPALGALPLADRFPRYALRWFAPAGAALGIAWFLSLGQPGNPAPLPFIPLLNPLELFQLVGLLFGARFLLRHDNRNAPLAPLAAIAAFIFATLACARAVHHLAGLPWSTQMLDSGITHAALTVLWSVLGVTAWIVGSRRLRWGLWLCGAILMGIVLAKLVLIDRMYFGNGWGIVSFLVVGGLLVLVGRIAPTPPRRAELDAEPAA